MKKNQILNISKTLIISITIIAVIYTIFELINIYKRPENLLTEQQIEVYETETINTKFSKDVDLKQLKKQFNNNDVVARLEIPNVFNILLTQTDNNNFYLKYNIKRERNSKGTEFIDFRNSLLGKQINIYGHNSKYYDSPFKKLELFNDIDFFNNNEYILLQHSIDRRIYKIVSFKKITTDYEHMQVEAINQKEHIKKLLENSIHKKELEYNDDTNILVLQTCTINQGKSYYLLIAFEIK